jgi:hypothetical protein
MWRSSARQVRRLHSFVQRAITATVQQQSQAAFGTRHLKILASLTDQYHGSATLEANYHRVAPKVSIASKVLQNTLVTIHSLNPVY